MNSLSPQRACATGICLLDLVKTLRIHREKTENLLPTELRGYLETEIRLAGRYPEDDFCALLRTLGRIVTYESGDVFYDMGSVKAAKDLREVFPEELIREDPWANLGRFEWVWHLYHDTGRVNLERLGETSARLELRDYDAACDEVARLTAGYLAEILRLTGAEEVQVEVVEADRQIVWQTSWA